MTRYGMVIDTKKCIGCHVCAMACKTENNLPNDVWWNRIFTDNGGEMGFDILTICSSAISPSPASIARIPPA